MHSGTVVRMGKDFMIMNLHEPKGKDPLHNIITLLYYLLGIIVKYQIQVKFDILELAINTTNIY